MKVESVVSIRVPVYLLRLDFCGIAHHVLLISLVLFVDIQTLAVVHFVEDLLVCEFGWCALNLALHYKVLRQRSVPEIIPFVAHVVRLFVDYFHWDLTIYLMTLGLSIETLFFHVGLHNGARVQLLLLE